MPTPVVARPVVPPKPVVRLNVLGYLQTETESKVFLTSGSRLFVVKKGARFGTDQEFYVEELTPDEVVVRQADRSEPMRLSLKTEAPQSSSVGFPPPASRPFRPRPGGIPSRPDVPDEIMNAFENEGEDEVLYEDNEPDIDAAGDEGSPGEEGVHEK